MSVVRVSRANFPAEKFKEIETALSAAEKILRPAIAPLNGFLHFYVGIDPVTNAVTNVSVWNSLSDAKQMDALVSMLELNKEFVELGVRFERPVVNFLGLWEI